MIINYRLSINNKLLGIVIALLFYTNIMLTKTDTLLIMTVIVFFIACICFLLIITDKEIITSILKSYFFKWCTLVWGMFIVYGLLGPYNDSYSLQFHLISYIYIILFMILIHHTRNKFLDIISFAFSIDIFLISIHTIMVNGGSVFKLLGGNTRVGNVGIGNVNTVAIILIFLLIPLLFQIIVNRKKIYYLPVIVTLAFMLLTGSKKSIFSLLVISIVFVFSYTKNINETIRKFIIWIAVFSIVLLLIYFVPDLHQNIWNRLLSMFNVLESYDPNDQSSTALRITFIIKALTKMWDRPFVGHGWGAFAHLYGYNSLYQTYMYSHCNYTEILFSFGIIGFIIYYSFPYKMIKKAKQLEKNKKVFVRLYMIVLFTLDIGSITCYDLITGYLSCMLVEYMSNHEWR